MSRIAPWLLAGFLATYALPTLVSAQGNSAAARQAARDRITARAVDRITRQPNPSSSQTARDNFTRRLDRLTERPERSRRPEHPARPEHTARPQQMQRRDFELSPRENALRRQLAEVDRLRDRALVTGNEELLDRANALESQIQTRFQQGAQLPEPLSTELTEEVVERLEPREFERGLGRETARQVRGLEPLPDVEIGAPGFGRRTAAERRYLRGQEPRGPWDALYRPMPMEPQQPEPPQDPSEPTTEPPTSEPPTSEPPVTEPPTTEPATDPSTGVEPLPPIEEPATP